MSLETANQFSLKPSMEKILQLAKDQGIVQCEVLASKAKSTSLKANEGKLDEYKISAPQILGVRLIKDQKVGLAYSESSDDESLKTLVKTAIENSQFSKTNLYEEIQENEKRSCTEDYYNSKEDVSLENMIQFTLDLEKTPLAMDKRVQSAPYNNLSNSTSEHMLLNSKGTECYDKRNFYTCYTSALIKDGDQQAMHYYGMSSPNYNDLSVETVSKESVLHAANFLEAKPLKSGSYDVIFDIDVLASLFGTFAIVTNGKQAQEGLNPWREKLSQEVIDSRISLIDDPTLLKGYGYGLFDDEGTPTQRLPMIENGTLKTFLHNSSTANYFKTKSTGHASRSAKSGLSITRSNLVITSSSSADQDELYSGKLLKVISVQGLGSGSNPISGDFSFAASGYLLDNNEQTQVVKEVTISGNWYSILKDQIGSIGNTQMMDSGRRTFSPEIRFTGLTVSG
ncbi:MAG: TldD/PmbA family protein [Bacteriovoracaceae bacterium]